MGQFSNGQSILPVIDSFSSHLEFHALKDISFPNIVKRLFNYITTYDRPFVILSDLGSHVYNVFNDALGIKILYSSVAHPRVVRKNFFFFISKF